MLVYCDCNHCVALIEEAALTADLLVHIRLTQHTQQRLDDARKRQLPQYRTVYSLAHAKAEPGVNKTGKARVYEEDRSYPAKSLQPDLMPYNPPQFNLSISIYPSQRTS